VQSKKVEHKENLNVTRQALPQLTLLEQISQITFSISSARIGEDKDEDGDLFVVKLQLLL
jgi:hypothetical protein